MEDYINNNTLVENEISTLFKDSFTCPLCKNVFINPYICMNCQKVYCKKCIDNWSKSNKKCPNNCEKPNYQECLGKKDILSKLKFKCSKCAGEIDYDDAERHHNSCTGKTSSNTPNEKRIKKLTSDEVNILKQEGNEITYITGKKYFYYYLFKYSNHTWFN